MNSTLSLVIHQSLGLLGINLLHDRLRTAKGNYLLGIILFLSGVNFHTSECGTRMSCDCVPCLKGPDVARVVQEAETNNHVFEFRYRLY